ncbi:unnamed protein product [Rodentolepis nana]|uniref:PID domain-containing protein n=1 Tax=Rodentolepis nana TaxID=102285 RepID=A0A0R3TV90_RODNA|nr:unnamed protein product [Rodentolepis nana]
MRPVDPEILSQIKNNRGVAPKPSDMGPVWCPYDLSTGTGGDFEFSTHRRAKKPLSNLQKMCQGVE